MIDSVRHLPSQLFRHISEYNEASINYPTVVNNNWVPMINFLAAKMIKYLRHLSALKVIAWVRSYCLKQSSVKDTRLQAVSAPKKALGHSIWWYRDTIYRT